MKVIRAVTLVCLMASGEAFMGAPLRTSVVRSRMTTRASMSTSPTDRPEIEEAEAAALAATKKYGAQSREARLAWDTYEEVASADNSIASRATLDEDCDVEHTEICAEYSSQMKELEEILAEGPSAMNVSLEQLVKQNMALIEENSRLKASLGTYKK